MKLNNKNLIIKKLAAISMVASLAVPCCSPLNCSSVLARSTTIFDACLQGDLRTVIALVDDDPSLVHNRNKDGRTALMVASQNGHIAVVRELLDRYAGVNATDRFGFTALMWASGEGHIAVVRELLNRGANIHATDRLGRTALILAQSTNKADIVDLLRAHH